MTRRSHTVTPVYSYLVISGWHGSTAQMVVTVGITPKRFRVRAITRTRLTGRNRWLEPGDIALVPKSAVRHGEWEHVDEVECTEMERYEKVVQAYRPVLVDA